MRYWLPTLVRRVELAFVQQTKEQTYKFTGGQRECSFVLMSCGLSKLFVIESLKFRTVVDNASGSFYNIVTQVTVSGFAHFGIFRAEVAWLVLFPNDATVFRKGIVIRKSFDGADLRERAG